MHRLLLVLTFGSLLTFPVFASQADEAPQTLSVPAPASQEAQASLASLTNKDVIGMLHAGLTPEIVIAKIKSTSCAFDTSPDVLKQLKVANVPDAVILAMVQVPRIQTTGQVAAPSNGARGYVKCGVNGTEVYLLDSLAHASVVAKMKCGDSITLLSEQAGYYTARTEDGAEGYISRYFVSESKEITPTPTPSAAPSTSGIVGSHTEKQKQEEIQQAIDDRDDCNLSAQNEYQTKMNVLATMALAPMMRVAASNRLKQNLDSELRGCRSRYEIRLKSIENK